MTKLRKKSPRSAYFYTIELQSRMAAHVHLLLRFPDEKTYINTDNLAKLIGGTRLKGSLVQWGPVIDIQQVGDDMNRQIVDLPANKVAPLGDGERLLRYMTKSIRDGLVQDVADIDGLTESERKKDCTGCGCSARLTGFHSSTRSIPRNVARFMAQSPMCGLLNPSRCSVLPKKNGSVREDG